MRHWLGLLLALGCVGIWLASAGDADSPRASDKGLIKLHASAASPAVARGPGSIMAVWLPGDTAATLTVTDASGKESLSLDARIISGGGWVGGHIPIADGATAMLTVPESDRGVAVMVVSR